MKKPLHLYAPISRYISIRLVLALVAVRKWKIHQMDVKTAFLNGVVEEEVHVEQPLGFETRQGISCVQIEESPIRFETSTQDMVQQN